MSVNCVYTYNSFFLTAMQNGGLSSYVSNPFSLLSGNRTVPTTTASDTNINLKSAGVVNANNAASSRGDSFGGLNKSQINALWGLSNPGSLYRPNNINLASANMLPTSGSRLGMSMNGPYAGAYGGLMPPSSVYPRSVFGKNIENTIGNPLPKNNIT